MKLPFAIDLNGKVAVVTGGGVLCAELAAALAAPRSPCWISAWRRRKKPLAL